MSWPSTRSSGTCAPVADPREARQARLRERLRAEGLAGLLVTHLPNIRYLTGFSGSSGALLVLPGETVLVTDFRYETQAPDEVGDHARVEVVRADLWERVARVAGRGRGEGWGFESESTSVATARKLADNGLAGIRPVAALVEDLRVQKSEDEVEAIRAAAHLAEEAFAGAVPAVRPGIPESEVAAVLEAELRRRGSEWHPFPTIVASGPRSALPHARTTQREIQPNDVVLVDFGAQLDGYCADLTRVVVAGKADDRLRMVFELVRDAQAQALAGLRAGLTGKEGDALARTVIEQRGFGEAFGHSLGHGLGLEVHEAPRLSRSNEKPLPEDSVVTVEPGVYLPGWGGIRLEDDVRLTADGVERLSGGQTDLIVSR
jgi:Xaa-Pro aminopeptidase